MSRNKLRAYSDSEMKILVQYDEARRKFMEKHDIADLDALLEYTLRSGEQGREVLAIGDNIPGYSEIVQTDLAVFQNKIAMRNEEATVAEKMRGTTEHLN